MSFVDAAYLVALAERRDQLHGRALAWARTLREPFVTTEHVMWEVVNYLSKPADRAKAHHIVRSVFAAREYEVIPASPELFEAGLQLHAQRADKEWSLTDCISFHIMNDRGITRALTHDHHFEQAGFEALLRRDPP
jgi:predicted nucleic acid-binding protein